MASAPHPFPGRRRLAAPVALWLLAAVVFLAVRVPFLDLPLERDEGEHAYIAQRLAADADFVPYRDAFIQKPPAAAWLYGTAFALLGEDVRGLRLFVLGWMAATTGVLGLVAARLAGPLAGAFAALAFAAASASPALLGPTANTEMLLLLPLLASLLAALAARGPWAWFAAGLLGACALAFKPVAAPLVAFIGVLAALAVRDAVRGAERVRLAHLAPLAALLAGLAAGALPVWIYFALRGGLDPFLDAVVRHNLLYASAVPFAEGLRGLASRLAEQAPDFAPLWLLAGLGVATPLGAAPGRRLLLAAWLLASFIAVSLGFYYRPHYFLLWIPALCMLAGGAAAGLVQRAGPRRGARAAVGLALAALLAGPTLFVWRDLLFRGTPDSRSRALYGMNPFPDAPEVGRIIRESSQPDESVLVMGSEPEILFHARRPSATRYIITYPLLTATPDAAVRQAQAVAEIQHTRPRHVLLVRIPTSHARHPRAPTRLFRYVTALVARDYELEALWIARASGDGYDLLLADEARARGDTGLQRQGESAALALYRRREP